MCIKRDVWDNRNIATVIMRHAFSIFDRNNKHVILCILQYCLRKLNDMHIVLSLQFNKIRNEYYSEQMNWLLID